MCGGSKTVYDQTTGQTTTQSDLPEWAKPYFERNIAKAEAEFNKPYEAYTGERLAATDPNVTRSREMVEGLVGSGIPGLGAAQDYASAGSERATELGNYGGGDYLLPDQLPARCRWRVSCRWLPVLLDKRKPS